MAKRLVRVLIAKAPAVKPESRGPALLRSCLARLEWSPERLAREINRVAGADTVSAKAPYGWLKGSIPRGRVPQIAALALSRALGEHVSAASLWPTYQDRMVVATAYHGLDVSWDADGARRCAQALSQPTGAVLLPISGAIAISTVVDWLTAPPPDHPAQQAGETVAPETVRVLAERVGQLRRLDDLQGGPLLLDWIAHDLRWAATLTTAGSYDEQTGRGLFAVLAQLGQLGGWLAVDLDQSALGQRLLLAALHWAHTAADRELAANIVSCLSYLWLWTGAPHDALRLIRLARQGVGADANNLVVALLASREGRALAQCGELDACARVLDEAHHAYAARTARSDHPPAWAYWISEAVITADAGRAWLEAGKPHIAEPLLDRGLSMLGNEQPRNRLLHGISLAQSRLDMDDVNAAVDAAGNALDLARTVDSARVRQRLARLRTELNDTNATSARQLVSRLDELAHA